MPPKKHASHSPSAQSGHAPRKRFGQNFLVDQGVIHHIVQAVNPQPQDVLVEIGPGLGALTDPLLARAGRLHVVEIDRDLIARLKQRYDPEKLTLHAGDALAFDFGALGERLRIVGNLPYNISTPLLFHLAGFAERIHDMHFMLQKEVVERMTAEPGGSAYGRLSVMLQYRFYLDWLFDVPPESFDPAPRVESAVVRLMPKPAAELCADMACLEKVVATAFSQRRKMLRNNLKTLFSTADLTALNLAPDSRPEQLPLAGFIALARRLAAKNDELP
ncbi:MAG: 16S rRNA (adenine(1518)-N(6)/adenine(1519)-N(6))-dimethyltransferase RsmA [Zoogloeaceae bacterium]|nr:16S rRNA (adenine(1518)-N(6)/adenine(1519)-N(6))-dimethyltransferase RsmA [Zoogloeaceae bacterium]